MTSELYRAPAECPVCGEDLIIIRKGCTHCGSELAGEFASSPYDRLDAAEHELLRVFLTSRGNLREVEKHLQVSYPTARARFDALLMKLGMSPENQSVPPQPDGPDPDEQGETKAATPQEQILARVATGEISAEVAAQLIAGLE
ncbi:DUF2089 domain-containing protein [[Pseudopropionibacterium] massiliense]|uniref:DUF2089 domain-containing protein n=1 Tax=[Pseudopropionibacterium] massiliense TaxID=2220000 RepID=UPI001031D4F1|nr:DUF2089 domain-containing protein [[Pseudopropionibacterium] massiliense]